MLPQKREALYHRASPLHEDGVFVLYGRIFDLGSSL